MLGNNPIRQPLASDGSLLEVKNIFRTIQGEGPNAGTPAIFLRLGGCNLSCAFCDTEFENFAERNLEDIIQEIEKLAKTGGFYSDFVVITGGEPFRQPIENLCRELIIKGFKVQVETNGTLFRQIDEKVEIVCSPKNQGNGYKRIRDDLLKRISAIKFLISAHNVLYSDIADVGQNDYGIPVYIQPIDEMDAEKNSQNMAAARELALKNGCNVSLQLHKILNLP